MMNRVDYTLDRITMYRLVLYVLTGLITVSFIESFFKLVPFTPTSLFFSTIFLVAMSWATSNILSWVFEVPANIESSCITALILVLIVDPAQSFGDYIFLGWVAILAISSKYILSFNKKHIFNPAAISVVITGYVLNEPASWWIGAASMLPAVLIGGFLIIRKMRLSDLFWYFMLSSIFTVSIISAVQGLVLLKELQQLLIASPLFFFGCIMLTEPLTLPPTRNLRKLYGIITGILIIPQVHIGAIYSTPELALVWGNIYSYLVSPKKRLILKLKKKGKIAADIFEFVFKPPYQLAFTPGQYMEWTFDHPKPDRRGIRRYFTLASSPTEDVIRLGVKFCPQSSSFKKNMYAMTSRSKIVAGQIAGDFILPDNPEQKLVFIAGGIGITPFRSMLKFLIDTKQRRDIVLFYINKTANEIAYVDILNEAQAKIGAKIYYTLTDGESIPKNWSGNVGRYDEKMIQFAVPDIVERIIYLSGPPEMVKSYDRILKNIGIRGTQIKKDFFPGLV